jgi:hypothetical protein
MGWFPTMCLVKLKFVLSEEAKTEVGVQRQRRDENILPCMAKVMQLMALVQ